MFILEYDPNHLEYDPNHLEFENRLHLIKCCESITNKHNKQFQIKKIIVDL